jgi:hypothetical protein
MEGEISAASACHVFLKVLHAWIKNTQIWCIVMQEEVSLGSVFLVEGI